jgi:hypothetical protein
MTRYGTTRAISLVSGKIAWLLRPALLRIELTNRGPCVAALPNPFGIEGRFKIQRKYREKRQDG